MTPTILIGVGGLGSSVVDAIKGKLPKNTDRNDVSFLIMDTDINWIQNKLKYLSDEEILQTSINKTVGDFLKIQEMQGDYSHKVWFDSSSKEILGKDMVNGAGQVRQVSKLAFDASMKSGKVKKLKDALNALNRQDTSGEIKGVRVVIVSSLAGGTGAGIYQQVAFLVRKLLNDQGISTTLVKGFFLLGGVLDGTGTITKPKEKNNIFANTFASFKELSAFTVATSSSSNDQLKNLDFQFHPEVEIEGFGDLQPPYDYFHLIDYNNTDGKNLSTIDEYMSVIINTIYTYIFSPIAEGAFSKLDNQIREIVKSKGLSRVCGSGAGKLFYPYEDIVRLFALKRTNLSISDTWLKFDRLYDKDVKDAQAKRNNGDFSVLTPIMSERYLYYLAKENEKELPNPIFKKVEKQLALHDDRGIITHRKSQLFANELKAYVEDIFKKDEDLNAYLTKMNPDLEKLQNKEYYQAEVSNRDKTNFDFSKRINELIQENRSLVRNVILDDGNKNLKVIGRSYNEAKYCFNYWVLNGDVMHPIAVRAFIYELINILNAELIDLRNNQLASKKSGENISKFFKDDKDGKEISPMQAAAKIGKGSLYYQHTRGKKAREEFAESFVEYISKSQANYLKYGKLSVEVKLKEDLLNKLVLMATTSEGYFGSIESILNSNTLEIDKLSKKYAEEHGYDRVVLGSEEMLSKLWNKNATQLSAVDDFPEELSLTIYNDWYQKLIKKSQDENFEILWDGEAINIVRENLSASSEKFIREGRGGNFDKNIVEAILLEAEFSGIPESDRSTYLQNRLMGLKNLVVEFGPDIVAADSSRYAMWGIHPESDSMLSNAVKNKLRTSDPLRDGNDFINHTYFDKREIIRAVILMGQTLDNFKTFRSDDNGKYYLAYKRSIKEVTSPKIPSINPHLDKRWHMPKYLPEIEPTQTEKILNELSKMLVYGLMSHKIKLLKSKGLTIWTFLNEPIYNFSGELIKGTTLFDLWDALQENMHIVAELKDFYYKQDIEKNFSLHMDDIKSFSFILNSKNINYLDKADIKADHNILEIILRYALMPSAQLPICERLLNGVNQIIDRCMKVAFSSLDTDVQKEKRISFVAHNYARGNDYLKNNKFTTDAEYIKMKEIIDGNR